MKGSSEMKNSQLLKDFKRLLSDNRVVWASHYCEDNKGVSLKGVRFLNSGLKVQDSTPKIDFITFNYFDLISKVKQVVAKVTVRSLDTLLYSLKYDTGKGSFSLAITNCSNFELYGVKHLRLSHELGWCLYSACENGEVNLVNSYCDSFISNTNKIGGYQFHLDGE